MGYTNPQKDAEKSFITILGTDLPTSICLGITTLFDTPIPYDLGISMDYICLRYFHGCFIGCSLGYTQQKWG